MTEPDKKLHTALTIAGSDPCGGAGIQADLKTFSALGVYGMSALTALTAQNTQGVQGVEIVPPEFLEQQLKSVFDDMRVDAVKIGMLGTVETIDVVSTVLSHYAPTHIVLDPVMVAKSGDALLQPEAVEALTSAMEPLLIVFLGITVGGVVIAMYMPLFTLISALK